MDGLFSRAGNRFEDNLTTEDFEKFLVLNQNAIEEIQTVLLTKIEEDRLESALLSKPRRILSFSEGENLIFSQS